MPEFDPHPQSNAGWLSDSLAAASSRQVFASGRHREDTLWAVTSYFNPVGYRSRWRNYAIFREHLAAPLLTVALEFGETAELSAGDADILVRLTEGDVLWQKERLFNLALEYLPAACEKILWLDADTVFPEPDWLERVDRALDHWPVVQPFRDVRRADRALNLGGLDQGAWSECAPEQTSAAYLRSRGIRSSRSRQYLGAQYGFATPGLAWATERSFIESTGFFDQAIIGSGDLAFWSGVSGDHSCFLHAGRIASVVEVWQEWQPRAHANSQGRVGYLDATVLHLPHGDRRLRNFADRWEILRRSDFDPRTDIRIGDAGTWLWSSPKPDLHQEVAEYFVRRREDEPPAKPAGGFGEKNAGLDLDTATYRGD